MTPTQPTSSFRLRIEIIDVVALVAGYGLAAVFIRAFWPERGISLALGLFAVGFYLWLGLAMSGPLLLIRHRHPSPPPTDEKVPPAEQTEPAPARTWAEMAWLLIGVYWIVLGVFVLPVRLRSFRYSDAILFGLVPLAPALFFLLFGPRPNPRIRATPPWTHLAACGLLWSWPLAWVCLIVLGETML
jgi:hypothetical protein